IAKQTALSMSASPQKKRRLSTSPADDRRVNVNESLKKVKQDNPTGSGSSSSTTKSESISPKIPTLSTVQQGKTGVPTVRISAPTNTQHPLSQSSTSITMTSPSANIDKEKLSIPTAQTSTSAKGKANTSAQTQSTSSTQQSQCSINQESTQDLLVRLTKKEEEIQSLLGELQNLSQTLTPDFTFDQSFRKKFLDPAINLLFRTMKKELEDKNKIIESLQHELEGVKFTPNSITGKKLVTKLRALQDENEELGRQLRQGRVEQYEVEIALQRKMIYELKQSLEESDNQLISMDNEMERLQDLVFRLRAKVKLYEDKFGPLDNPPADISKSDVVNEDTESTKVEQKEKNGKGGLRKLFEPTTELIILEKDLEFSI
ncbi:16573_t:CDS:2, partial [Cetraspora pellucida]